MSRQKRYYLKNKDKINVRRRELRQSKKQYWTGPCEICAELVRVSACAPRVCASNDCRVERAKRLHATAMRRFREKHHVDSREGT